MNSSQVTLWKRIGKNIVCTSDIYPPIKVRNVRQEVVNDLTEREHHS